MSVDGRLRTCARCGQEITLRPNGWWRTAQGGLWCGWSKVHAPADDGGCCQPVQPPTAAAYRRHLRAGTVPCPVAVADSAAYRAGRPRAEKR